MTARDDTPPHGSTSSDCIVMPSISRGNQRVSSAGVSGTRSCPPATVAASAAAASRAAWAAARESLLALALPASRAASSRLRSACCILSSPCADGDAPAGSAWPAWTRTSGTAAGSSSLAQVRSASGISRLLQSR